MTRSAAKKPSRRQTQAGKEAQDERFGAFETRQTVKRDTSPVAPLNECQKRYINAMKNFTLTFATGPAGTGKTWLCAALAAQMLEAGEIDKIIITRPAVEAGESLGFLPGELEEKFDPWLQPFRDVLNERLGKSTVEFLIKRGIVEAAPLAYMRGRTFKRAFVIMDEAQNTTPVQMKMFLTRIGNDCRVVVNGDMTQKDVKGESGLEDAVGRLSYIPSVKHIRFDRADVVRSGIVQEIVSAYDTPKPEFATFFFDGR
ncbi:MAG: PhoH family protein [Betaproteobacteria bacterium]|nr:PhoH family protein [Betaproteobacteria bacterium]